MRNQLLSNLIWLFLFYSSFSEGNPADLREMFVKIEQDTSTFAHKMEELILKKCNYTSDETCYKSNFDRCTSELPYATCPGNEYAIQKCGNGQEGGCGGLFDFTTSVVTVAPDHSNPYFYQETENDRVKDDVCSTLRLEEYMKDTTENSKSYWQQYDVFPPWMYFGTDDGVFRKFPASPGKCPNGRSDYDPRLRPWYVAASSGPKDVVLVLDTSFSMDDFGRMDTMKAAAKRVINTLSVGDYFSVIQFSNNATFVGNDSLMQRATDDNKARITKSIESLSANGGTYFSKGFQLAFDTLNDSMEQDRSSGCHRAILFLTDGKSSDDDHDQLLLQIKRKRNKFKNRQQSPPVIFTYSFGAGADDIVPRNIACQTDGIWAKINDREDLAKSMGAYYKYFAYGLGEKVNGDFVAWVEPYRFSTAVGLGTTASAPVFDRTVDPPILAGVVGMDISFAALQKAFGTLGDSQNNVMASILQLSGAACPQIDLTPCQLESLRKYGSDDDGNGETCNNCNSSIPSLKTRLCSEHATELWNNTFNRGRTYEERTCCSVGSNPRIMGTMTDEEIKQGVCKEGLIVSPIVSIVIGTVVAAIVLGSVLCICIRRRRKLQENPYIKNSQNGSTLQEVPEQYRNESDLPIASFDTEIVAVPVPVAAPVVAVPIT